RSLDVFSIELAANIVCRQVGSRQPLRHAPSRRNRSANSRRPDMSHQSYPLWSANRELLASRDRRTGEWVFPAVPDDSPLASHHETVPVEGDGTVYSFTIIHPGAKTGLPPYALGYVDFDGPVRIFGRLQGNALPAIGDHYRPREDESLGYVFEA